MATPTLEEIRARIAGPEPVLVIEAPAGYGKTEEAVEAAKTSTRLITDGQYVLFLTHTHAARATFNRRLRGAAAVMKTIHSLAAEIVDLYAMPLGLPRPLQPHKDGPPYDELISLDVRVLRDRPEVARGLAGRYPVILVDEYQDCTIHQASLISAIATARPTKLRMFGDDLQAIYEFAGEPVDFLAAVQMHPTVALTTAWRWSQQPEMQKFLVAARAALLAGKPIDLTDSPSCVTVSLWDGQVPPIHPKGYAPECVAALRRLRKRDIVFLTLHNDHALGLRIKMPHSGGYHEGANRAPASEMLDAVIAAEADPAALTQLLIRAMMEWGLGMTKDLREQIQSSATPGGLSIGRKQRIAKLAVILEGLYADPTVATWLECLRRVLNKEHGIPSWRPIRVDQLHTLASIRPGPEEDPHSLVLAATHARTSTVRSPRLGFMTIHRAKGLQFDEVALPYCAGSLFQDDPESRRRLYVAISRAQRQLHFLIPQADPTPLLHF